jgi:hypothetical protein
VKNLLLQKEDGGCDAMLFNQIGFPSKLRFSIKLLHLLSGNTLMSILRRVELNRVARYSLVQDTQNRKVFQLTLNYTKWPQNVGTKWP